MGPHLKIRSSVINHVFPVCEVHLLVKSSHSGVPLIKNRLISNLNFEILLFNFRFELLAKLWRPLLGNIVEVSRL